MTKSILVTCRAYIGDGSRLCVLLKRHEFDLLIAKGMLDEDSIQESGCAIMTVDSDIIEATLRRPLVWRCGFPEYDMPLE